MIPKPTKRKKKKYKTPLPKGDRFCQGCGSTSQLEVHHVYYGVGNRNLSSKHECVEWLCNECHRGNNGVHGINKDLDNKLKVKHQEILEISISRQEFIKLFGRNYLG